MSGIAGVFYRDGRPLDREPLGQMLTALAHRGPDGSGTWSEGSVGLVHLSLWTTPESIRERQPLLRGDVVIVADARIDNRDELIALLALDKHLGQQLTDTELIAAAYERWGRACAEKLLGDFAFVIWDKREQRLFCARDHSGLKPFYYYLLESVFAFASEIKALLCLPEVNATWDNAKIASYLLDLYMLQVDNVTTFFHDIYRLPPAHIFSIDRAATNLQSYWSLDQERELRLASDQHYPDPFLEIFPEPVPSPFPPPFPSASPFT